MEKNSPVLFLLLLLVTSNCRCKVINTVAYQGENYEKNKTTFFLIEKMGVTQVLKCSSFHFTELFLGSA